MHKSIYDHLTRMTTEDKINDNALKVLLNAKKSMLTLAAYTTLMQSKCSRRALALWVELVFSRGLKAPSFVF